MTLSADDLCDVDASWFCHLCGKAIGVYEPAVVYDGPTLKATSRLNQPETPAGNAYHTACWRQRPPTGLTADGQVSAEPRLE